MVDPAAREVHMLSIAKETSDKIGDEVRQEKHA